MEVSGSETRLIAELGGTFFWGLGMVDENLYGFSATGEVHLLSINGQSELVQTTEEGWWGATTNPIWWQ